MHLTDNSQLLRCYPAVPHADAATARAAERIHSTGINRPPPPPVSLAYHSVMLYGRTWYERQFGARPVRRERDPRTGRRAFVRDERAAAELARVRAALALAPAEGWTAAAFDAWFDEHVADDRPLHDPRWAWLYGDTRDCMRDAWLRRPASWSAFFREVNARCGCAVFAVLVETVAKGALGLHMGTWLWEIRRPPASAAAPAMAGGGGALRRPAPPALAKAGAAFFRASQRAWEREVGHGIMLR